MLAAQLGIEPETLDRYINGEALVPMKVFLVATEILTNSSVVDASRTSEREPKPPVDS